jgi:ribokinase
VLIQDFCNEGVNTDGVIRAEQGESGSVFGFVDRKGARALYINSGVNDTITLDEVNTRYAAQAQFLHLTSFVGDESFQTQKKLLDTIPDSAKVSFDPGALYARRDPTALDPIIRKTYVLMPNAIELTLLTGEIAYSKGAEAMIRKGVKIIAVKLGNKGCYVTDGNERHLIDPLKVKAVDTTGAGDAFCAGFLYGLVKGKSLLECGKLGNFVASRCVMKMGARTGLPLAEDLELLG